MTPTKMAVMVPITAPAITAVLGPEGVGVSEGVIFVVGVLVVIAVCEGARVEGMKGRKADGMDTVIPWISTYNVSIHH
jgi:hypothetical protein